jgi:uncharacterized membrane protein YeaQ/YmgE (transglycosylase-associated protein family)
MSATYKSHLAHILPLGTYEMLHIRSAQLQECAMHDTQIGWIGAIIVGGLAGWLAEMFMGSGSGIIVNIILGIVGAAVASWLFGLVGIGLGGWIGYLIAGFVGACILIALWRLIQGRRV